MATKAFHLCVGMKQISISRFLVRFKIAYLLSVVDADQLTTMSTMHFTVLICDDVCPDETLLSSFLLGTRSLYGVVEILRFERSFVVTTHGQLVVHGRHRNHARVHGIRRNG